jgi:hypothetical protein
MSSLIKMLKRCCCFRAFDATVEMPNLPNMTNLTTPEMPHTLPKRNRISTIRKKKPLKKVHIPKALRAAVWIHYVGEDVGKTKCIVCGYNDITQMAFHCGHVIAESKGGGTSLENLRPICSVCNLSMGTMHMFEFKETFFPTVVPVPDTLRVGYLPNLDEVSETSNASVSSNTPLNHHNDHIRTHRSMSL